MMVVAAAAEELGSLEGHVVGVGPVVAGVRAAAIFAEHRPSAVVLIGTAGVYPGGTSAIGQAIAARSLGLSWGVAALGLGYVPRPPGPLDSDPELLAALDLPKHDVLTAGAITTDPELVARLADGWTVEHLEAYAVAYACHQANIPFCAVLGIANVVGPEAHSQWLTHRDAAQRAAREAIAPLLQGPTP